MRKLRERGGQQQQHLHQSITWGEARASNGATNGLYVGSPSLRWIFCHDAVALALARSAYIPLDKDLLLYVYFGRIMILPLFHPSQYTHALLLHVQRGPRSIPEFHNRITGTMDGWPLETRMLLFGCCSLLNSARPSKLEIFQIHATSHF